MLIIRIVDTFIYVLMMLIVANALMSWFVRDPYNQIYRLLNQITEPIVAPFRKITYRFGGNIGMDFSPMLAIVFLIILRRVAIELLARILL